MSITRHKNILFVLSVVLLLFTGCQNASTLTAQPAATSVPWIVPTPKAGMGVVKGQLLSSTDGKPIDVAIYLAKNLTTDKPELPPLVSLSTQNTPRGNMDASTGNFYFTDIEPGNAYVIALLFPSDMEYIKTAPNKPVMVTVEAGKTVDVGVIKYP